MQSVLSKDFRYTSSVATDVSRHWPNLPMDNERRRMERAQAASKQADAAIVQMRRK